VPRPAHLRDSSSPLGGVQKTYPSRHSPRAPRQFFPFEQAMPKQGANRSPFPHRPGGLRGLCAFLPMVAARH
jgi:hypothetical protein